MSGRTWLARLRLKSGIQIEWGVANFGLVAYGRLSGFILEGQVSSSSADVDAGLSL